MIRTFLKNPAAPVGFSQLWVGRQILNNNNGWLEEDPEEEEDDEDNPEEDPEEGDNEEEEMEVEEDMMLMIHRVEDMAVAPTPDDHEQEAEANTVGTITRVPLLCALFLAVLLVGSGPSRQWSFEVQWHLHSFRHYRERPYVAPTALVAHVDRADPDDPSPCPTRHPRHDDPYVMVRDAATRNGGDDTATTSNLQPSQPPGSPHYHLYFHGNEGAVELSRWFKKTESVFSISECAERNKVATLGLEVVNAKSWNDMKIMMREEFYPQEEIQRMEVELWNFRVKDSNKSAYTQRFNELVLLCPEMVLSEKKKVEAYLRGLPENIKGETSSRPVVLNEAVRMAHTLMEQKLQAKAERIAASNKEQVGEQTTNRVAQNNWVAQQQQPEKLPEQQPPQPEQQSKTWEC
ncbi:putative reverse transcriptase domain-containing protein [Tanacetum coccineum]